MKKEDLKQLLQEGHCSPGIAARMAKAGIKPQSTGLTYDKEGKLGNGGWIAEIWEAENDFFPAVNLFEAILLLETVCTQIPELYFDGENYQARTGGTEVSAASRVDALCLLYLQHKE